MRIDVSLLYSITSPRAKSPSPFSVTFAHVKGEKNSSYFYMRLIQHDGLVDKRTPCCPPMPISRVEANLIRIWQLTQIAHRDIRRFPLNEFSCNLQKTYITSVFGGGMREALRGSGGTYLRETS